MKALIDNEQLISLREQAIKVDKILLEVSGVDMRLTAQIGFLIGMIRATKYTAKPATDEGKETILICKNNF